MKNLQVKLLYYILTYFLCLIAALSIMPLLKFWYLVFFAITCAWGMFFSAHMQDQTKQRIRSLIGIFLIIVFIFFLMKISPNRAALPYLMLLFLLVIALSSFTVKNTFQMNVVHFESLFLIIFSTCLPFAFSAGFRAILLFVSLFITIFLLQITRSKLSSEEVESAYIVTNINITRRFILSFLLSTIIVFVAGPLILLIPKFSISLNLDRRGSSVVDFKLDENENLRLLLPEKGKGRQIARDEVVPYVRSLFFPKGLREKIYEQEDFWKQPLYIKQKDRQLQRQEMIQSSTGKLSGSDYALSQDGDQEKRQGDAAVGGNSNEDEDNELRTLLNKRRILKADISKKKTLYRLISSFGDSDPEQKKKLNALLGKIKANVCKLELLEKQIEQAKLTETIKKDKEQAGIKKNMASGGPGNLLLAKKTADPIKGERMDENDGTGVAGEKQTVDYPGGSVKELDSWGDGIQRGTDGTGEGQEGSGKGTGEGKDGSGKGTGEGKEGSGKGTGEGKDGSGKGTGEGKDGSGKGTGEGQEGSGKGTGEGQEGSGKGTGEGQEGSSSGKDSGNGAGGKSGSSSGKDSGNGAGGKSGSSSGKDSGNGAGGKSGSSSDKDSGNSAGGKSGSSLGKDSGKGAGGKSGSSSDKDSGNSAGGESGSSSGNSAGRGSGSSAGGTKGNLKGVSDGGADGQFAGGSSGSNSGAEADGSSPQSGGGTGEEGNSSNDKQNSDGKSGKGTGGPSDNQKELNGGDSFGKGIEQDSTSSANKRSMDNFKRDAFKKKSLSDRSSLSEFVPAAQGEKLKKKISPESGEQQILPDKQDAVKKHDNNKSLEQSKLKQQAASLPEKLQEQTISTFDKIRENKVLFYLFCFFSILFAIIFVCVILYLSFIIIRKIVRDLKMHYFYRHRPDLLIINLYHNLRFVFLKTGRKAKPYLTPKEIADESTGSDYYFIKKEVLSLTDAFIKARYSNNAIDEEDIHKCVVAYNSMKKKIAENFDAWKNLFLKLNMFSFLKQTVYGEIEDKGKDKFQ